MRPSSVQALNGDGIVRANEYARALQLGPLEMKCHNDCENFFDINVIG